ncbi:amidohydrolase [Kordiimonas pumila]|uniref:Amidohydrolase n=1 Tax=Kordiimonas pumila TaxID=2161677 RepID=A0ABV7D882_9PROT|nr:amidohydrolase family protein [Kordiimonas pumila]
MKKYNTLYIVTCILALCLNGCSAQQEPPLVADLILTNGYIYTANEAHTVTEAIAIKGNSIIATGTSEDIAQHKGPNTLVRDLEGKMVMPGLHDMHIHALGSVRPDMCDLDASVYSLAELVPVIQECIRTYNIPDGEWVPVLQWNPFEGNQPSTQYPTIRAALDAASSTHPIIMWGNDGHHGAVNSLALQSPAIPINAETLKTTYAAHKSLIAVDDRGEPTGGMMEGARNIVRADMDNDMLGVSSPSSSLMPRVAAKMAETGITSIQDAAVTEAILDHYLWLAENGGLTFRLRTALVAHPDSKNPDSDTAAKTAIDELKKLRHKADGAKYIDTSAMKIFADGVLEGNPRADPPSLPNAAMIDGYEQPLFNLDPETGETDVIGYVDFQSPHCQEVQRNPDVFNTLNAITNFKQKHGYAPSRCIKQYGHLAQPETVIKALVREATEAGYHVHIHAIADRAVKVSADAFEAVAEQAKSKGLTQSIAHLQIGKKEDVERLSKLGTFVAFTYVWASPLPDYEMTVIPFIDKVSGRNDLYNPAHSYIKEAYPFKSVLEAGGIPVFGSDAPVGSRDPMPFVSMATAVTREAGGIVLNATERLNIHQAIASYTRSSAKMMAHADTLGTLDAGMQADLIILDRNIVQLAEKGQPEAIAGTKVLTTIFDGHIIYDANSVDQ